MSKEWEKIYARYSTGGPAYATLSRPVSRLFKSFVLHSDFKFRSTLDIGFGDGRYLKWLQSRGFETAGIDYSKAAFKLSRKILGKDADLQVANMFNYRVPKNRYDFIYSVNTIHHGEKSKIKSLLNRIYASLISGGKIFISFPFYVSRKDWKSADEVWKYLRDGATVATSGPETGLIHSLYKRAELASLFKSYRKVAIEKFLRYDRWIVMATK
jgi:cyclopropane fatty-acyl-phospholipid synthase-like methyltransferase